MTKKTTNIRWTISFLLLLAFAKCDGIPNSNPVTTVDGKRFIFKSVRVDQFGDSLETQLTVPDGFKVVIVTAEATADLGIGVFDIFLADGSGAEVSIAGSSSESSESLVGGSKLLSVEFAFIVPETATGPYAIRFGDNVSIALDTLESKK